MTGVGVASELGSRHKGTAASLKPARGMHSIGAGSRDGRCDRSGRTDRCVTEPSLGDDGECRDGGLRAHLPALRPRFELLGLGSSEQGRPFRSRGYITREWGGGTLLQLQSHKRADQPRFLRPFSPTSQFGPPLAPPSFLTVNPSHPTIVHPPFHP